MSKKQDLIEKADWMAAWTMSNAIRLHYDSITLFKERSYPSSLALSILAMEEIAKAHLLEDYVYNGNVNNWNAETWKIIKKAFFSHKWKQESFAEYLFPFYMRSGQNGLKKRNKFVHLSDTGGLEKLKQNAIYVGLSGQSFMNSRIRNPFNIPRSKPLRMITLVNDYLISLTVGHILEYYIRESEYMKTMLKPKFVRQLRANWRHRSITGIVALRRYKKMSAG